MEAKARKLLNEMCKDRREEIKKLCDKKIIDSICEQSKLLKCRCIKDPLISGTVG